MQTFCGQQIEEYVYLDMDGNGANELLGTYASNEGIYYTWYCSSDGSVCELVHQNDEAMEGCTLEILPYNNERHVCVNAYRMLGTRKNYSNLSFTE